MDELKHINRLESAGFSTEQAKAITEVVEDGIQSGFDRFVEVLERKLGEMESRLKVEIESVKTEMHSIRADLLKEQGHEIDRRGIELDEPIRSLGVYNVKLRLHPEVTATVKLWVVKE